MFILLELEPFEDEVVGGAFGFRIYPIEGRGWFEEAGVVVLFVVFG